MSKTRDKLKNYVITQYDNFGGNTIYLNKYLVLRKYSKDILTKLKIDRNLKNIIICLILLNMPIADISKTPHKF